MTDLQPDDHRYWPVIAARAADEKLGTDIVILEVGDVLSITDHFVLVSGANPRQIKAIIEEVEAKIKRSGGPAPIRLEGADALEWVLMDYGDFIVHVLHVDAREYYEIERLWADTPNVDWRDADDPRTGAAAAPGSD